MKRFILTTLFLFTSISFTLTAQQISSDSYNKDYIHEDFNSKSETFKVITTTDNYFILDKGDYLLSRNNNESEYAIIAKNSLVSDFVLKTSIRIGPSDNKRASIGIILKAQNNGKGAIIFEINKKGEYRVKQLIGSTYQSLSGNAKKEGWVKSKILNGVDEHNFIEIRSEKNIYDVYTNNKYLTTFFVPDLTSGLCGLIISPETKARISYYYINVKGNNDLVANYTNEDTKSVNSTIEELKKKIILLEENNTKLNKLNLDTKDLQKEEIDRLNSINKKLANSVTEKEKEIINLNLTISELNSKADKVSILETQKTNNLNTIKNLENDKSILNNKLKESTTNLTNAKEKNSTLAAVSVKQAKEIADLNSTITNLNSKVVNLKSLENKNEKNLNTITKLENENNTLNKKIKESNKKLDNLNEKNSSLAAVSLEQEKKIASLNLSLRDLKTESDDTKKSNSKLTKKANELQQQISLEQSVNSELTNDLNDLQKSSSSKITKLNKKITKIDNKVNSLTEQNNVLESNLAKEKSSNKKINTDLSKSLRSKKLELKKLKLELQKSNNQLAKLNITQAMHDSITNNLNIKITDLNQKLNLINTYLNTANDNITALKATNNELKELFILKDFERNGVKPSEIVKEKENMPPAPKVLIGNRTFYSVQLGVYMQKPKDLDNIWYNTTDNGTYIYYSGEFDSPQQVTAHKNKVAKLYPNAFVVTLTK